VSDLPGFVECPQHACPMPCGTVSPRAFCPATNVKVFMQNHQRRALVLFSGGQDSTTCLAWALDRYAHVETVAFDYGQRHRIELDARLRVLSELRAQFPDWAQRLGEDHLLDLRVLGQVGDTAMTSDR